MFGKVTTLNNENSSEKEKSVYNIYTVDLVKLKLFSVDLFPTFLFSFFIYFEFRFLWPYNKPLVKKYFWAIEVDLDHFGHKKWQFLIFFFQRATIFQTFWKDDCCSKSLFIELGIRFHPIWLWGCQAQSQKQPKKTKITFFACFWAYVGQHCKCFICWIHRWMSANQIPRQLAVILTD